MRDVSSKKHTLRTARAQATLRVSPSTIPLIREGRIDKGDVLESSKVAAIWAAKNTAGILPYCHPIPVEHVRADFELGEDSIRVTVEVKSIYKTGVEMEALTAASVAALNAYDMLKPIDEALRIESVELIEKTGGKSSFLRPKTESYRAGIVVASDRAATGQYEDLSGPTAEERLLEFNIKTQSYTVVQDEVETIRQTVVSMSDAEKLDIILIIGGTGVAPRDVTPEAVSPLLQVELPGIAEAIRSYGAERNPYAILSRSLSGIRGKSLILCLPGSPHAVRESLLAVFPAALHVLDLLQEASPEGASALHG